MKTKPDITAPLKEYQNSQLTKLLEQIDKAGIERLLKMPELPTEAMQIRAMTMRCDDMLRLIGRIAVSYPGAVGRNACPPSPHGCDKCEIYFLLEEFANSLPLHEECGCNSCETRDYIKDAVRRSVEGN